MIITKDKIFYKNLFRLAFPILCSNLLVFLVALSDSLMIGRLGDEATSTAYIGTLVLQTLQMLLTGIDGGISVICSQFYGKGDKDSIKTILSISLFASLFLSFLLTASSLFFPNMWFSLFGKETSKTAVKYLILISLSFPLSALSNIITSVYRAIESVKVGVISSAVALITNLFFNYFLIFGKLSFTKHGVIGAAISTMIARLIELFFVMIYLFFIDKKLSFRPSDIFKFKGSLSRKFIKYVSPLLVGQLVWIFNTLFAAYVLKKVNTGNSMAGVAISNTINTFVYIFINALSASIGIIIAKEIGKNKIDKIKEYSHTTELVFLLLGFISSVFLFFVAKPFTALYNTSEETAKTAITLIKILSLTVIGTSYQSACLAGLIKNGGDVTFVFKCDSFFVLFAVLPLTLIAVKLGAPLWLVFLTLKSDHILKCIPAAIKTNRFNWIRRVTEK